MSEHSLRRRYGLELGFGLALAGVLAWMVLARGPSTREGARAGPTVTPEVPADDGGRGVELARSTATHASGEGASARSAEERAEDESELVVLVTEADGVPRAGVELRLSAWSLELGAPLFDDLGQAESRGSEGRARFVLGPEPRDPPGGHVLTCLEPFARTVEFELGAALPREPVTFALPPHGALVVELTRDGAPAAEVVRVDLAYLGADARETRSREGRGGRVHFPVVGLGLEFELLAWSEASGSSEPVRALGPVRAGEVVSVALGLGSAWPRARLRIVDEHGRARADELFTGWVECGASALPLARALRSDARGELELRLPEDTFTDGARTLVLRSARPVRPADSPAPLARKALPEPLDRARSNDLGSVVLPTHSPGAPAPRRTLVAGSVQDERGQALAGARLMLFENSSPWQLETLSDGDGRFAFEAEEWPGECVLSVTSTGYRLESLPLSGPDEDLLVTLRVGATFRARLLFDADVNPSELMFGLQGPVGAELVPAAEFVREGLAPGSYTLVVRDGRGMVLARFHDLVLAPGDNAERVLDLRGGIVPVLLRLSLPDGAPFSGLVQAYLGEEVFLWRSSEQGEVRAYVAADEKVRLFLEGHRWLSVDPLHGRQELRFEAE